MVAEVGERLVHVDAQGLGKVLAVVVLTVGGLEPSATNRLIGEVVQSQRRPLLGPSPG